MNSERAYSPNAPNPSIRSRMRVLSEPRRASRRTPRGMSLERVAAFKAIRRTPLQVNRSVPLHNVSSNIAGFRYKSTAPTLLVSTICTKPAQLTDKRDFQLPLLSNSCALFRRKSFTHNQFRTATSLFSWKSFIFNVFPKTYRGCIPPPNKKLKMLLEVRDLNPMLLNIYNGEISDHRANQEIGVPRKGARKRV
jgi:hypothetical protein